MGLQFIIPKMWAHGLMDNFFQNVTLIVNEKNY